MDELPTPRTARKIIEEKTQRPAAPETNADSFGDKPEDLGLEDAGPPTEPNLSTHPGAAADEVVPQGPPAARGYLSPGADDDRHPREDGEATDDGNDNDRDNANDSLDEVDSRDKDDDYEESFDEGAQNLSSEDATNPNMSVRQTSFDESEELPPRAIVPAKKPGPVPSDRATTPQAAPAPQDPTPEQSSADRVWESLGAALRRVGSGDLRRTRWLVGGAAAALALVIAGNASLSGNRGVPPEPAGTVAAPAAQTENQSVAPAAAPLVPATVSATCPEDSDAVAPFAGEKSRAWVCGRVNGLDGSVLNITFTKPMVITEITVVPGFNYVAPDGRDEWERHRQATGVTWRMGGQLFSRTMNPTRTGATMKFPSVVTQEMSMTITATTRPARGSADVDGTTAVSSIVITGYPVDPGS
jgi:hypothetical protein